MTAHDKLRKLAENATPGPWFVHDPDGYGDIQAEKDRGVPLVLASVCENAGDDAEFIAAANPTAVLALLDELAAREAEVHRLRELTDTLRRKGADLTDQFMELTKEHARLALERDAYRRGQGPAPTPATPGTTALHEAHPIPNSRGDDQ